MSGAIAQASQPRPIAGGAPGIDEPDEPVEVGVDRPFTAQVFKAVFDTFVGKISYFRVFSGTLPHNASILAPHAKGAPGTRAGACGATAAASGPTW